MTIHVTSVYKGIYLFGYVFHGRLFIIDHGMHKRKNALFIVLFSIEHVYRCANLLHWVHLSVRLHMWPPRGFPFTWFYFYIYFMIRVWAIWLTCMREASDLSLGSLDHNPSFHPFLMWLLSMLWYGSTSTHIFFPFCCFHFITSIDTAIFYHILSFLTSLDVWLWFGHLHTIHVHLVNIWYFIPLPPLFYMGYP